MQTIRKTTEGRQKRDTPERARRLLRRRIVQSLSGTGEIHQLGHLLIAITNATSQTSTDQRHGPLIDASHQRKELLLPQLSSDGSNGACVAFRSTVAFSGSCFRFRIGACRVALVRFARCATRKRGK